MKVMCAPDSFKESLTAVQAANAIAEGVRHAAPDAEIDRCPIGDGGEGTLDSLLESVNGQKIDAIASDVFGRPVETHFASLDGGRVAFVESAAAVSLAAIPAVGRDVMRSSSFGVGQLILSALDTAPEKIIVGVGGSASNDGGCGMAQALGVRFYDASDELMTASISAESLPDIRRIDTSLRDRRLGDVSVIVASDVENPFTGKQGASRVFAPQKGASEKQVAILDDSLRHVANIIRRDLGIDIEAVAGAGASGGLGGGLIAFAEAKIVSGIDTVLKAVQFESRVQDAHLCLTGEGSLDAQSLAGKACIGVAKAASTHGVPTIVLAGQIGPGAEKTLEAGVTDYFAIGAGLGTAQSISQAAVLLTNAADRVTRKYR